MKQLSADTKFAYLGKAGSAFTPGFRRRLEMITKYLDLKNKTILDMGCGDGVWLEEFAKYTNTASVFGSEYDKEKVDTLIKKIDLKGSKILPENIKHCPGEALNFSSNFFDVVFHNEVLEHVQDDVKTLKECLRVLKPNGHLVFFTPNRGWPFEQHGIFFNGKYIWGNIPLLPWLPKFFYKKFAYHVRNYSNKDIRKVIDSASEGVEIQIVKHTRIFPGFDGMVRRLGLVGRMVRKVFFILEGTPLNFFGISHFIIVKKNK